MNANTPQRLKKLHRHDGFMNPIRSIRDAHISLWRAGRGTAPSPTTTSRSRPSRRHRRGTAADPPSSDRGPRTDRRIVRPTANPRRSAAAAPAKSPPSSRRRWSRRRQVADEAGEQKSLASSPPRRRARLDTPAPHLARITARRRDEDPEHLICLGSDGIDTTTQQNLNN